MNSIAETIKRNVLQDLAPLFQKAKAESLWFCCRYQQLWFSPEELAAKQAEGKFLWGPVHWELRSPSEHLRKLRSKAVKAEEKYLKFRGRVRYANHLKLAKL